MSTLDPTIPLRATSPATNPLQTAMQALQMRYLNANTNQLQQTIDANNATSEAYRQAVDPSTGQLDTNKLSSLIAANPASAYNYAATMKAVQDQRQAQQTYDRGQIGLNNDQIENYKKGLTFMTQQFSTLSPNDPNFSAKLLKIGSDAVQMGHLDPNMVVSTMSQIPQDPNQRAMWFKQKLNGMLDASQQLDNLKPQVGSINTGGATQFTNTDRLTGQVTPTSSINNTLTPAEQATQVNTYQNGQPGTISNRQNVINQGNADLLPNGAPGPAAPGNGRYPGNVSANGGFNPTGAPMGAQGVADEAGKRYGSLQAAANTAKNQMKNYDLALDAVGAALPGKGGSKALNVPTLLNTFGIQAGSDTVKNNQLLLNYLNSAADQAASALGLSGSDARLAAAKAGQPDPENMNVPALMESIRHVKGLQQAVLDRSNAVTAYLAKNGNNTGTLPQFESAWNRVFDPDVSLLRSLPQDQRAAWLDSHVGKVGSAARNNFLNSYDAMAKLGAF